MRVKLPTTKNSLIRVCVECGENCTSKSYTQTTVSFSDHPDGHNHDDNRRVFYFRCVCGEQFSYSPIKV